MPQSKHLICVICNIQRHAVELESYMCPWELPVKMITLTSVGLKI